MGRKFLLGSLSAVSILAEAGYAASAEVENRLHHNHRGFLHSEVKPDTRSSPKSSANLAVVSENREAEKQYILACEIKKRKSAPLETAVELLQDSAKRGYAPAQHDLAVMLLNGKGCDKDIRQAIQWYDKAAAQRYGAAENALGVMYEFGNEVVQQDFQKALELYEKADQDGFPLGGVNAHRLKEELE